MARAEFLQIRFGNSRWLTAAQILLASLGGLAILATPADWMWKLGGFIVLMLFALLVHFRSTDAGQSGTVRLFTDGTAVLMTASRRKIRAIQEPHAWVSRWFSVLALKESGTSRNRYCVVCASQNHPEEYRRLLKFLRMRTPPPRARRMIW